MNVTIKYSVRDLVGNMRDGAYELPEGTTVDGLIHASQAEVGKVLSEDVKNSFIFLVNSRPAQWETVLKDGDKVRVLYKILGG
jgi:molybdopterin converting factor small subunit